MSAGDGWHEAADDLELLAQVLERDDVFDEYNGQGLRDLAAKIRDELAFDAGGSRTVAVDFDGVLHGYSRGWADGTCYDFPLPGAAAGLAALARKYRVVVYTARDSISDVRDWLVKHDLAEYVAQVTGQKPSAVAYVDDRAICFGDDVCFGWPEVPDLVDALVHRKRRTD